MTPLEYIAKEKELKHQIQTAIKLLYEKDPHYRDCSNTTKRALKHHRVGIDSLFSDLSAIVGLLVEKGVITQDEYFDRLIKGLENEVELKRQDVQQYFPNQEINLL